MIASHNPHYHRHSEFWILVHDSYTGASEVKDGPHSLRYLPPQKSELEELEAGITVEKSQYGIRRAFASYENFFRPTIDDISGIMQKNPAIVRFGVRDRSESPPEVVDIEANGNRYNDGLSGLKYRLNFNQVLYGRYGLLLDVVTDDSGLRPRFCISEYPAVSILDGQTASSSSGNGCLEWVLLDETSWKIDLSTKTWSPDYRLRVLGLDRNGDFYQSVISGDDYCSEWLAFDLRNPPPETTTYPEWKQRRIQFIPFTICNVNRLGWDEWQEPPYMDVAQIAISHYQVDSWYKKSIRNHATPTLVVCNADKENQKLFLGGAIWPKSSGSHPASVSLLETTGSGMAEMRNAKEAIRSTLRYSSIRDLLDGAGANSSGNAIQLRTASGTAAIAAIDRAGAKAIEEQLVFASDWSGVTHEQSCERISYTADTAYLGSDYQLQAIVALIQANQMTNTLSPQNLYAVLEKSLPGVLSSFEDNEEQKIFSGDEMV
ncbi:MAG: DUF4055 domain-containing protein [Planctomycetia bacterium]|nr:DUF4055 domain-containing protein [Planctomycetia bacterium]